MERGGAYELSSSDWPGGSTGALKLALVSSLLAESKAGAAYQGAALGITMLKLLSMCK